MAGHKWEPMQAVIIQLRPNVSGHGAHREHHYLVRVEGAPGQQHMHWVTEKSEFPRQVGETVAIEVNAKAKEVRLDHARNQAPSGVVDMAQQIREGAAAFGSGPAGFAGGPGGFADGPGEFPGGVPGAAGVAGGLAALMAAVAAGQAGSAHPAMLVGGQHVQVTDEQRHELAGLAQSMMSGDPATRQAAVARMHELRDQIRSQAGQPGQPGQGTGQPGGFGQQGFDQPGFGQPGFGQQGGSGAPQFPGGAPQPAPQPSGSFGSFDTSGGQGSREQRIAKLQELLDKGILTQSEFEAQRQQILGG